MSCATKYYGHPSNEANTAMQYYNSMLLNQEEEEEGSSSCSKLERDYKRNMILTGIVSGLFGFIIGAIAIRTVMSIRSKDRSIGEWAKVKARKGEQFVKKSARRIEQSGREKAVQKLRGVADRIERGAQTAQDANIIEYVV